MLDMPDDRDGARADPLRVQRPWLVKRSLQAMLEHFGWAGYTSSKRAKKLTTPQPINRKQSLWTVPRPTTTDFGGTDRVGKKKGPLLEMWRW
jgi:hypothetical protein